MDFSPLLSVKIPKRTSLGYLGIEKGEKKQPGDYSAAVLTLIPKKIIEQIIKNMFAKYFQINVITLMVIIPCYYFLQRVHQTNIILFLIKYSTHGHFQMVSIKLELTTMQTKMELPLFSQQKQAWVITHSQIMNSFKKLQFKLKNNDNQIIKI